MNETRTAASRPYATVSTTDLVLDISAGWAHVKYARLVRKSPEAAAKYLADIEGWVEELTARYEAETRQPTIEERVAAGVALLDAKGPADWRSLINLDILNLDDAYNCILGQLYGEFIQGARHLGIGVAGGRLDASAGFGFYIAYSGVDWATEYFALTVAWMSVLA